MNYEYIVKFPETEESKYLKDINNDKLIFAIINVSKNVPIISHLNQADKKTLLEDLADVKMHYLEKSLALKNIVNDLVNLDVIYFSDLIEYKNNFIHIIFYKEKTNSNN